MEADVKAMSGFQLMDWPLSQQEKIRRAFQCCAAEADCYEAELARQRADQDALGPRESSRTQAAEEPASQLQEPWRPQLAVQYVPVFVYAAPAPFVTTGPLAELPTDREEVPLRNTFVHFPPPSEEEAARAASEPPPALGRALADQPPGPQPGEAAAAFVAPQRPPHLPRFCPSGDAAQGLAGDAVEEEFLSLLSATAGWTAAEEATARAADRPAKGTTAPAGCTVAAEPRGSFDADEVMNAFVSKIQPEVEHDAVREFVDIGHNNYGPIGHGGEAGTDYSSPASRLGGIDGDDAALCTMCNVEPEVVHCAEVEVSPGHGRDAVGAASGAGARSTGTSRRTGRGSEASRIKRGKGVGQVRVGGGTSSAQDIFSPAGRFMGRQSVASALDTTCSKEDFAHNDVKPENILLSQASHHDHGSEFKVKLEDLGQAQRGQSTEADLAQRGMTTFCKTTSELFDTGNCCREDDQDTAAAAADASTRTLACAEAVNEVAGDRNDDVVVQSAASALDSRHSKDFTHSDIKPGDILRPQANNHDRASEVNVKLGDLGRVQRGQSTEADLAQYGTTISCTTMDVRCGTRELRREDAQDTADDAGVSTRALACAEAANEVAGGRSDAAVGPLAASADAAAGGPAGTDKQRPQTGDEKDSLDCGASPVLTGAAAAPCSASGSRDDVQAAKAAKRKAIERNVEAARAAQRLSLSEAAKPEPQLAGGAGPSTASASTDAVQVSEAAEKKERVRTLERQIDELHVEARRDWQRMRAHMMGHIARCEEKIAQLAGVLEEQEGILRRQRSLAVEAKADVGHVKEKRELQASIRGTAAECARTRGLLDVWQKNLWRVKQELRAKEAEFRARFDRAERRSGDRRARHGVG